MRHIDDPSFNKRLKVPIGRRIGVLLMALTLLCISIESMAQTDIQPDSTLNKNVFHGSIGILFIVYVTATGYYERIIKVGPKLHSFVRVGYGGYGTIGDPGEYILAQAGILTGAGKNHLELGGAGIEI